MSRNDSKKPIQHRQFLAPASLYRFLGSTENFVYADERLRPTWKPRRDYRLTAEHRRQLCIHIAAHAAVSSLGGALVHMLAVAPVGVRSWTIGDRKTRQLGRIWGVCSTSDFYCSHIVWDDKRQSYAADRDAWEYELGSHYESLRELSLDASSGNQARDLFLDEAPTEELFIAEHHRVVRAHACGYLAGHIADGICVGMNADEVLASYERRDTDYAGPDDIAIARGLAELLPFGEYEHAVHLTEEALRRPHVWAAVERVAAELEKFGLLEGSDCESDVHELLPDTEDAWPYAPGAGPDA
jgi:hypothetical protein